MNFLSRLVLGILIIPYITLCLVSGIRATQHETSKPKECLMSSNGAEYRGTTNQTKTGRPCGLWALHFETLNMYNAFKDSGIATKEKLASEKNYCRNLGGHAIKPWCFTIDRVVVFENCNIPECEVEKQPTTTTSTTTTTTTTRTTATKPTTTTPTTTPEVKILKGRPFYIISKMNGKVLDVKHGISTAGTEVIMYGLNNYPSANQQWYLDYKWVIRSKLNSFALEAKNKGDPFNLQPCDGSARRQWVFQGRKIVNKVFPDECLGIQASKDVNGAKVVAMTYTGSSNQHWRVDYVNL